MPRTGTVAIIPARGGSRGIPRKNLMPIGGRPLVLRSVDAARAAASVDRVVVSTDDEEISRLCASAGALVAPRPAALAGDTASSESALLHTLDWLRADQGVEPELIVFLQCTSPLTSAADIDAAVAAMDGADCALSVTPFHGFVWRSGTRGLDGVNHDPGVRLRRQDAPVHYVETGAIYVLRTAGFRAAGHRFFGRIGHVVIPRTRSWEVDDPTDLVVAAALLSAQPGPLPAKPGGAALPAAPSALILDFDGVFTDNRVLVFADGTEAVSCNRSDGAALARLRATGLPLLVLSAEANPVVRARAEKLGLPCIHGVSDKAAALQVWLAERGLDPARAIYVGNDRADLACMRLVGTGVAVADAWPEVRAAADLVLERPGGAGALRELADLIEQQALIERQASMERQIPSTTEVGP